VDPRSVFLEAAYAQVNNTDTTDARTPIEVTVKSLLEASQGAPPSGAVLFVVNETYGGRLFTCEHRRAAN
jgi:hypothetical protein